MWPIGLVALRNVGSSTSPALAGGFFTTEPPGKTLCLVAQSCLTLCNPMDCSPPGSSVHGDFPGKNTGVGCHALLQGIDPRMALRSPTLQVDSLLSEPPEKPKKTGVGSLSFLQGSSQPTGQIQVSCIAGGFFTS